MAVTVSFDDRGLRLDTSEDADIICQELIDKMAEVIILQGNTFGIEAAERVGAELAHQSKLREAHFKDIFTTRGPDEVPEAMAHLLRGICASGAQLKLLDLSDNAVGPIGAPSVIEFLESPAAETLEHLNLNNCGLGPEGSTSIAPLLRRLKNLREFICGRDRLENKGAINMSLALADLNTIEVLKLNQNGIKEEGIRRIVEALRSNRNTLRVLDLSDNTIKVEGANALSQVLAKSSALRELIMDDALLMNAGFSLICDGLSKSPYLPHMAVASFEGNELHGNKIVDLIDLTFSACHDSFSLNLLENEFTREENIRLQSLSSKFEIILDDLDSDSDYDEQDDDEARVNGREEGEIDDESDGYIDIGNIESDMREVSQDFIKTINTRNVNNPHDSEMINSAFIQLISTGVRPSNGEASEYQAVQILCEELGLIKTENCRKKKPLESKAVDYIGKRVHELPNVFKSFFEVVIKNNEDTTLFLRA